VHFLPIVSTNYDAICMGLFFLGHTTTVVTLFCHAAPGTLTVGFPPGQVARVSIRVI